MTDIMTAFAGGSGAIKSLPKITSKIYAQIGGSVKYVKNNVLLSKFAVGEYESLLSSSVKNLDNDIMVLGKYKADGVSYIDVAKQTKATYFDMGNDWSTVQNKYKLSDKDMFVLFNVPALDNAISQGKTFKFTHDPTKYKGALLSEYNYLLNNGYSYDPMSMIAKPIK